ncbi:MAG: tRNA pseudouridine(38-40) synthase TruA [Oscillospiraceae bacterium]|nr:tRNA pseudouridine(38-40) synthase TruA [Oscillospiraceae bacterium]MBR6595145.1 tRNA pseudouridine(38-40) synthase TruA [Oscillospiraceae bacterium]
MRNLRLDICYDGTRYRGWQRLPGPDATIQGKIEQCLSKILGEPIEISGSGRTDAGVHALGQVANFHCQSQMNAPEILENLRRYLPEDIGIYSCKDCSERFHARLNAREKIYRYRIWNSEAPCVFERKYAAVMPEKLDIEAMAKAAGYLEGEHDFSAFCGNPKFKKSTVRFIRSVKLKQVGEELHIFFTGNGFIHNQVRIMVGTLMEVGRGERNPDSIPALFGNKRSEAGFLAPAQGLCLMEVTY